MCSAAQKSTSGNPPTELVFPGVLGRRRIAVSEIRPVALEAEPS